MIKLVTIYAPKKYYCGIDESNNHRKIPEFYSLVLSSNPESIILRGMIMLKRRKSTPSPEKVYQELEGFKYLLLGEKIIKRLGQNSLKATIIAHLLTNVDINPRRVKVLIDGFLPSIVVEEASKIYRNLTNKRISKWRITLIEHGDQGYPIINSADQLAYTIYKNLNNPNSLPPGETS